MTGTVYKVDQKKGFVYLNLEDGQQCWFELLGGYDIEVGDIVTGNLWTLGGEELTNTTKDYKMSVFIQDHT